MSRVVVVTLTGTISKEGDEYVSVCHELGISTTGKTSDEVWRRTDDMLQSYFEACRKLGTFDAEIKRLTDAGAARLLDENVSAMSDTPVHGVAVPRGHDRLTIHRSWSHRDVQRLAL